jgi:aspartate-semialdehyde dehydrogenase
MTAGLKVAVVEPTDLVGSEIIKILEERRFPLTELILLGNRHSAGEYREYLGQDIRVRALDSSSFKGVDLVFFPRDSATSLEYVPRAKAAGAISIDLSPCFSLADSVPLVVPEVNASLLRAHQGIIACPRAATIQLVLSLAPVHRIARMRRVIVSTYQAVSDSGSRALDELTAQVRDLFSFRETTGEVYPQQIAFNALPQVRPFAEGGHTEEEMGICLETRRILAEENLRISVTSVYVPVFYSHAESVVFETARRITPSEVREILERAPGVSVQDDPAANLYPTPVHASGTDDCLVGRIRQDISSDNGIALWSVCDNIRKGAALNAVQIAEQVFLSTE